MMTSLNKEKEPQFDRFVEKCRCIEQVSHGFTTKAPKELAEFSYRDKDVAWTIKWRLWKPYEDYKEAAVKGC